MLYKSLCVQHLVAWHGSLKLLEIDKVNRRTNEIKEFQGPDFAAKVLEGVGASYEIAGGSLDSIPAEGGFITEGKEVITNSLQPSFFPLFQTSARVSCP